MGHDSAQAQVFRELWNLTHYESVRSIPSSGGPWPLSAIIGAIDSGEYRRVDIDPPGPASASLRYGPLAVVEGFGQIVVFDSWNEGPPHRPEVGWDYERAKALVAAGRGVE